MAVEVNDIDITEERPQSHRISWWLENTLSRAIKKILNDSKLFFEQLFTKSVETSMSGMERELIPLIRPYANMLLETEGVPEYLKKPIRAAIEGTQPVDLIILGVLLLSLAETIKMGVQGPMTRKMEAQVDSVVRSALFGPELLLELNKRGIISWTDCSKYLRHNGVSNEGIRALRDMKRPLIDDSTLTQMFWRELVSSDEISDELSKKGMSPADISHWKTIRRTIPNPSELVSIAVREGFNDNIAATFGYDENYPTEAAELAEKGGMQQKYFKALWRAHWNLPGLVQVRDMYHRGIIEDNELDTYLLAADYPVYWREAIKQWMFRIVTRVDARRMYDLGVWNIERVYRHNLELGYNEEDAQAMTEWIALSYAEKERELTKTDILSMYKDGILNHNEANDMLTSLDFNLAAISLMLAHQDLKRDEQFERAIIRNVQDLYIAGIYDRTDVLIELGKLNTPPDVMRQSLAVWDLEKERKVMRPTVTQLRDMAQMGILTIPQWRNEMSNRRYNDRYISLYEEMWLKENNDEE